MKMFWYPLGTQFVQKTKKHRLTTEKQNSRKSFQQIAIDNIVG
jgi:hypothetical protein